jgi:hemin uptake protein HemP
MFGERRTTGEAMSATANAEDCAGLADADSRLPAATRTLELRDNCIDSRDLFVSIREITIAHGSDVYRLRLTSQNKLILTK